MSTSWPHLSNKGQQRMEMQQARPLFPSSPSMSPQGNRMGAPQVGFRVRTSPPCQWKVTVCVYLYHTASTAWSRKTSSKYVSSASSWTNDATQTWNATQSSSTTKLLVTRFTHLYNPHGFCLCIMAFQLEGCSHFLLSILPLILTLILLHRWPRECVPKQTIWYWNRNLLPNILWEWVICSLYACGVCMREWSPFLHDFVINNKL